MCLKFDCEMVEMYIDDEISDFWDSIAPTYHIVIDEDFNN